MKNSDPQKDYLNLAGKLWQQGLELNMRLWRDAMEGFYNMPRQTARKAAPPLEQGARTMLRAYENYIQLTMRYAEDVVKLGLDVSREMNNTYTKPTKEKPETKNTETTECYEIRLAGKAGEAISTGFSLESGESASRKGKMQAGDFIREETGAKGRMKTTFKPESFTIEPGQSQTIEMTITTPKNQAKGSYRSSVTVDGFEDASFDVLLELSPAAKTGRTSSKASKSK